MISFSKTVTVKFFAWYQSAGVKVRAEEELPPSKVKCAEPMKSIVAITVTSLRGKAVNLTEYE